MAKRIPELYDAETLRVLLEEHGTAKAVAAHLDCSYVAVRRWMMKHGLDVPHPHRIPELWDAETLQALLDEHGTQQAVAAHLGCTETAVRQGMVRHGGLAPRRSMGTAVDALRSELAAETQRRDTHLTEARKAEEQMRQIRQALRALGKVPPAGSEPESDGNVDVSMLGHRVTALRMERDMSMSQLSRESGVAKSWLSRIEGGRSPGVSMRTVQAIADALGVTAAELSG